jgi:hypothetical protein
MRVGRVGAVLAAIAAVLIAGASRAAELPADASARQRTRPARRTPLPCCGEVYRHVYVEGWYGSRKLVAPVRHGPAGDEVGLPNGQWLPCEFSCEYMLRKMHLYFWQDYGTNTPGLVPPDLPRSDFYRDDHGNRYDYIF